MTVGKAHQQDSVEYLYASLKQVWTAVFASPIHWQDFYKLIAPDEINLFHLHAISTDR